MDSLYTKEELYNQSLLPIEEEGRLNVVKFKQLIKQTREDIANAVIEYQNFKKAQNKIIQRYAFNLAGQLIASGSAKELEEKLDNLLQLGISREQITIYCNRNKVYDGVYFTNKNHRLPTRAKLAIHYAKRKRKKKK